MRGNSAMKAHVRFHDAVIPCVPMFNFIYSYLHFISDELSLVLYIFWMICPGIDWNCWMKQEEKKAFFFHSLMIFFCKRWYFLHVENLLCNWENENHKKNPKNICHGFKVGLEVPWLLKHTMFGRTSSINWRSIAHIKSRLNLKILLVYWGIGAWEIGGWFLSTNRGKAQASQICAEWAQHIVFTIYLLLLNRWACNWF